MGLMQKACETYEANLSRAGQVFEAGATLCPVGTSCKRHSWKFCWTKRKISRRAGSDQRGQPHGESPPQKDPLPAPALSQRLTPSAISCNICPA